MAEEMPIRIQKAYAFHTALLFSFGLFALSLFSSSDNPTHAVLLGRSAKLWFATVALGCVSVLLAVIAKRYPRAVKYVDLTIKRVVVVGLVSVVTFEFLSVIFIRHFPPGALADIPLGSWAKTLLPERLFGGDGYRTLNTLEYIDDPVYGYRFSPNLNIDLNYPEFSFRVITDSNGFPNLDESLYENADVVVVGDSFSMGQTVDPDQAWPEQFGRMTGLRVLNLGVAGWDIYQYPLAIEQFATSASPKLIIVTLTNWNDMNPRYYEFDDYKKHGGVGGYREFLRTQSKIDEQWNSGLNGRPVRNYLQAFSRVVPVMVNNVTPFTVAAYGYIRHKVGAAAVPCKFALNGVEMEFYFRPNYYLADYVLSGDSDHLSRIAQDFDRISEIANRIESELIFVYLPDPAGIYMPLLRTATNKNECARSFSAEYENGEYILDLAKMEMERALGSNIGLLQDATPYLQQLAMEGEKLTWTTDFHPNALGHRRIAEFMSERVAEQFNGLFDD